MFAAAEAHEELGVDPRRQIDVFAAVRDAGLELLFRPLRGVSGLYVPTGRGIAAGVLVSSHHPLSRQRFTAAHELGHFWLDHEASIDPLTEIGLRATGALEPMEMVAEAFAAWFLMPPELADTALEELGFDRPCSATQVYAMALRLGTSYQATVAQLPSLKLTTTGEARSWAGIPLKEIKEELSAGVPMDSYRGDVHILGMKDARTAIGVGPGDRLVLNLPGETGGANPPSMPASARLVADSVTSPLASLTHGEQTAGRMLIIDLAEKAHGALELVVPTIKNVEELRFRLEVSGPELGRPQERFEANGDLAPPGYVHGAAP